MFENFPYTNFHDLNLDWIIKKVKEAYSPDNPPDNLVLSVNGETGDVILYQSENVVFPDVTSDQWRMVRSADGHTTGVLFNQNYMYVMYDNVADRVYTMNHPPQFPVTSVDGETGAVRVFPNAASRLPDVTEDYTNIRRQIRTDNTDNVVGIELKQNKAYRMKDASRYEIFDSGNPPPYPVTSVNGETGAIVIAIPFLDIESDYILFSEQASGHTWSLGRETQDGTASIQLVTNSTKAEAYIDFYDGEGLTFTKKLLTADDIPSSSGVVSVNGNTGVVVLYGTDIAISSGDSTTVSQAISNVNSKTGADIPVSGSDSTKIDAALSSITSALSSNAASIDGLEDAIAIVANNNSHGAITAGQFVYVKNHGTLTEGLYKASSNIAANAALSSSNLVADSAGGLNALTGDIATLNSKVGLITKSILIGSGWSLSSAIVNELGVGRVKGIVAFTCTGNIPVDLAGYGMSPYGEGYVVCNDYYQSLWYSDTNGGIFTGYKIYSDTTWYKVQRIDNSIREYSMSASAEIPTTTELHNFFENTSVSDGTYTVSISTSSGVRSALIYTQASRKYGAGLLISYYNSSWYKVKNTNGTVTITAF